MVYAVIGLVVVLVAVGVGLGVWIARLYGRLQEANAGHAEALKLAADRAAGTLRVMNQLRIAQTEAGTGKAQLEKLHAYVRELEAALADGKLCTPAGVVDELRRLFSGSKPSP